MADGESSSTSSTGKTENKNNAKNQKKHNQNRKKKNDNSNSQRGNADPHKAVRLPPGEQLVSSSTEVCVVCAEDVDYAANYPCNHFICHKCSIRMRALMKNFSCALCRTEQPHIVLTNVHGKLYSDFDVEALPYKDEKLGVYYDSKETRDEVQSILKFNCPDKKCDDVLVNWKDLKVHVKKKHDKELCEICCRHKKAFTFEFELYTRQQLIKHERNGDKLGFNGHPQCQFCQQRYYSDDELFLHMRERHEKCFICDREHPMRPQYYKNYDALEEHFKEKHYACLVQSCLNEKFVVFGTKVELQDHMLQEHPAIMGKSKAARRIEPTYTRGDFGGELSTFSEQPPSSSSRTAPEPAQEPEQVEHFPALGSSAIPRTSHQPASVARFHNNTPPVDNTKATMQKRINERVRNWMQYDQLKFNKFQVATQGFNDNKLTAKQLILEYQRLMDLRPADMDILVHETSQLYKNSNKAKQLKSAFKEWQERQAFPILGSSTPAASSTPSTWVNKRPQSGSNVNDRDAFPSLPSSSNTVTGINKKMGAATLTPAKKPLNNEQDFPALPKSKKKPIPAFTPASSSSPSSAWSAQNEPQQAPEDPALDRNNFSKKGKKKVLYRVGL